ncbi:MAG: M6 family metalloprotease domain-containing protein [Bacillota bacterium]|nr:M6 family metalloprotease domain-containing protein [Bacillota bacterium]
MKIRMNRVIISLFLIYSLVFAQNPWWGLVEGGGCKTDNALTGIQSAPPNPNTYPGVYSKDRKGGELPPQPQDAVFSPEKFSVPDRQAIPAPGAVEKLLIIPVYFIDTGFDDEHGVRYFEAIAKDLKDYYEKNSKYSEGARGMSISATVVDPVRSSHSMKYYGEDGGGIDDANGNIYELAREAVLLLDGTGFDFAPFDTNSDGIIDHIIIIHAGDGQEDVNNPDLIWSHHWKIGEEGQVTQSGKTAKSYTMIAESSPLGVLAHEFGHDIGLPDLYDADGFANGYTFGVGSWDVMGFGAWNHLPGDRPGSCPANLSAWSREYMGWVEPIDTSSDTSTQRTIANTDGYSSVRRLWPKGNTSCGEYFLVEYRRKIGYDAGLPGEGILVWHVDSAWIDETIPFNKVNAYENRLGIELEQADGKWDLWYLENTGDAGDPFPGGAENYNFVGVPHGFNSSNIDGKFTYVELKNISVSGSMAYAYFLVMKEVPDAKPVLKAPSDGIIADTTPEFSWNIVYKAESYILQVSGDADFGEAETREYTIENNSDSLVYWGKGYTYKLSPGQLSNSSTYYWRVAAVNGSGDTDDPGNIIWSDRRSFATCSGNTLRVPANLSAYASAAGRITVTWDEVDGATGYIVMVDGAEKTCPVNEYIHSGLSGFTRHTYRVRAVNTGENSLSDWSDEITAYTLGVPTIEAEILGVIEGSEDGGLIEINLSNGVFRYDGAYNRATVRLDLSRLPEGVRQGNVARMDDRVLRIELVGNSTEDYDTDVVVPVIVTKEQVDIGRYYDLEADIVIPATVEPSPAAPNVEFSFDGPNADRLMGTATNMEYSLNGGASYTAVSADSQELTSAEIQAITSQNDILVRLKADLRIPAGQVQVIDILSGPAEPGVIGDDDANTVTGMDNTMEFSTDGSTWTRYDGNLPDLSGNVTLKVRVAAAGTTLAGDIKTLTFTVDDLPIEEEEGEEGGGGKRRSGRGLSPLPEPGIHVSIDSINDQLTDPAVYQIHVDIPAYLEQQVMAIEAEVFKKLNERQKSLKVTAGRTSTVFHPLSVNVSVLEEMGDEAVLRLTVQPLDKEELREKTGYDAVDGGQDMYIVDNLAFELRLETVTGDKIEAVKEFDPPVMVAISIEGIDLNEIDINRLGAYYYNEAADQWEYVGGRYNAEDSTITFAAIHFSCYAVAEFRKTFADIANHWAKDDIEIMAARHIAKGKSDTEFQPDAAITRAEFTALLVRVLELKGRYDERGLPFEDVEAESWYNNELASALSSNIISEDVVFRPDAAITRQEIVTMIVRALEQKGFDTRVSGDPAEEILRGFDDMNDISEYARLPFAFAVGKGIIQGRRPVHLVPRGEASRAEAIVFIKRVLDLLTAL